MRKIKQLQENAVYRIIRKSINFIKTALISLSIQNRFEILSMIRDKEIHIVPFHKKLVTYKRYDKIILI